MRRAIFLIAIAAVCVVGLQVRARLEAQYSAAAPGERGSRSPAVQPGAQASQPVGEAQPVGEGQPVGEDRVEVPPPPFTEGIFPCSSCHAELPVNRTRRELTDMHSDIVLKHDAEHRWCLDCHDPDNRDSLHLASGEAVPFEESYRLCGQCHGEKLRDWRAGVHGRRTGKWNGHKRYLLCAHCHNPHQPRFNALAPKPAPEPPLRPGG